MKRLFCVLVAAAIMLTAMSGTSLAHGGHGRGYDQVSRQTGYAPCPLDDCDIFYSHRHGRGWYCGQAGLSGDYDICAVSGCEAIGLHEHDDEYYHCRYYNTGSTRPRGCCRR